MKKTIAVGVLIVSGCGLQDPILFRGNFGGPTYGIHFLGGGGASSSSANSISQSGTGLSIYGGTNGNMGGNSYSSNGSDLFLASFGAMFQLNSVGQFGGVLGFGIEARVFRDASGNSYVLYEGKYPGATLRTPTSAVVINMGVAKFDSAGVLLWVSEFGSSAAGNTMTAHDLILSSDKLYLLGRGQAAANIDFGFTQVGVIGRRQTLLARLDLSTGAVIWGRQISPGGVTNSFPNSLRIAPNGDAVINGQSNATVGGTISGSGGGFCIFTGQFAAADGTLAWLAEQTGSATSASASDLEVDSSGNVYSSGTLTNTNAVNVGATLIGTTSTGTGGVVVQYNSSGARQWALLIAGGGATNTTALLTEISGGVLVRAGTGGTLGGTQIGAQGTSDMGLVKVTSTGSVDFTIQVGNGSGTCNYANALFASDGALVVGTTTAAIAGFTTIGTAGTSNLFGVRLNPATGALMSGSVLAPGAGNSVFLSDTETISASSIASSTLMGCGETTGTFSSATQVGSHGNTDIVVLRWNGDSSQPVWITQLGGPGVSATCADMTIASAGTFIAGSTDGVFGDGTVHNSMGTAGGIFTFQVTDAGALR